MKCPNCGKEMTKDQIKCECGFEAVPKKKTKKYVFLGIFALLAIVIVVSLFIPMKQENHDYVVASGEDGLYLIDAAIPKKEPVLIKELDEEVGYLYTQINADNTKLVYSCNGVIVDDTTSEVYELYVYDILEGTSLLIDDDVYSYMVNESCDTFTYFKGTANELWQCKVGEKPKKLLDKVYDVKVSSDASVMFYTDLNGNLYTMTAGEDPELVCEDVYVVAYGENMVLYNDNGKLIKYQNKEKTVISNNYYMSIFMTAEGGYFCANARSFEFDKYFTDDMLESDKNITAKDTEAFIDKIHRDELRLDFSSMAQYEGDIYSLYYFDGNKAILVRDNVIDTFFAENDIDEDLIAYKYLDNYEMPKITMSEFCEENSNDDALSIYDEFRSKIEAQSHLAIAQCDKELGEIELSDVMSFAYCPDTKLAYLHTLIDTGEEDTAYTSNYYKVELKDKGIAKPEIYDENVSSDSIYFIGNSLLYWKTNEKNSDLYDVYLDKKLIAENVIMIEVLGDSTFYIEKYDEDGNKVDILLTDSGLTTVKGTEELDIKETTLNGSIFCYGYENLNAAVITNGVVTPLSTNVELLDYFIPDRVGSFNELSGPVE